MSYGGERPFEKKEWPGVSFIDQFFWGVMGSVAPLERGDFSHTIFLLRSATHYEFRPPSFLVVWNY